MTDLVPITYPALPIVNLTGFPQPGNPLTAINPAAYRDGDTFMETLENILNWTTNTLVPYLNDNADALVAGWDAEVVSLVAAVNDAITQFHDGTNTSIQTLTDTINAAITSLNASWQVKADQLDAAIADVDATGAAATASATAAAGSATAAAGSVTDANTAAGNSATSAAAAAASVVSAQAVVDNITTIQNTITPIGETELGSRFLFLGDDVTLGFSGVMSSDGRQQGNATFAKWFTFLEQGKAIVARNAGVSGNSTIDMSNRYDTDVTPYNANFDTLFYTPGVADWNVDFTAYTNAVKSIVSKARLAGKGVVIGTMIPNGASDARKSAVIKINGWLKRWARIKRIPVAHFYGALVDPSTGALSTTFTSDGNIPNDLGALTMGQAAVTALDTLLAPASVMVPGDSYDPLNMVKNGTLSNWSNPIGALPAPTATVLASQGAGTGMTAGTYYYTVTCINMWGESLPSVMTAAVTVAQDQRVQLNIPEVNGQMYWTIYRSTTLNTANAKAVPGSTIAATPVISQYIDHSTTVGTVSPPTVDGTSGPASWVNYAGSGLGGGTHAKITDGTFPGSAIRLGTGGSTATTNGITQTISGAQVVPGHRLAICARARDISGTLSGSININFLNGGSNIDNCSIGFTNAKVWPMGLFYIEFVVPATVNTIVVNATIPPNADATAALDYAQFGIYDLTALGLDAIVA